MAMMLARNLDKTSIIKQSNYQDVKTHWAYVDIMEAKNAGIMLGVTSNTFNPEGSITRTQMAVIVYRWI